MKNNYFNVAELIESPSALTRTRKRGLQRNSAIVAKWRKYNIRFC